METRIIVAGSRTFDDYDLLKTELKEFIQRYHLGKITIVSGCASGADRLGERFAAENRYLLKRFPAMWKIYGKQAGFLRNAQMLEYARQADTAALVAFWDGQSRGTKHMLGIAEKAGIIVKTVYFEKLENL